MAADPDKNQPPAGRLVPGCADKRVPDALKPAEKDRFCRWVVHFKRTEAPAVRTTPAQSQDQIAVEAALTGLTAVQPAQIEGDRASVLAQSESGEFAVVWLERREGMWTTVAALNAGPAGKARQQD